MSLIPNELPTKIEYPDDKMSDHDLLSNFRLSATTSLVVEKMRDVDTLLTEDEIRHSNIVENTDKCEGQLLDKPDDPRAVLEKLREDLDRVGENGFLVLARLDLTDATILLPGDDKSYSPIRFNTPEVHRESANRFCLVDSNGTRISDERLIQLQQGLYRDKRMMIKQKVFLFSKEKEE